MVNKTRMPNPAYDHGEDFVVNATERQRSEILEKREEIDRNLVLNAKYTFAELAIGEKSRKYIAIFKQVSRGNFFIPNFSAGFFGLAWLIYRRAAFQGFIVYSALVGIGYELFVNLLEFPKMLSFVAMFAFAHAVLFFIGNFIYFYSVTAKIKKYRKLYGETSSITYLSEQGGTLSGFNFLAPVVLLQGGLALFVYCVLSFDGIATKIWNDFMSLANV